MQRHIYVTNINLICPSERMPKRGNKSHAFQRSAKLYPFQKILCALVFGTNTPLGNFRGCTMVLYQIQLFVPIQIVVHTEKFEAV
jgi:hypothetical protein